jgi:hypothetical protein
MDAVEKFGLVVASVILLAVIAILGTGLWGFVEFIQWVTSK